MRKKTSAKAVSMDFAGFLNIPDPAELHGWLKEQGVLAQVQEEKNIGWGGMSLRGRYSSTCHEGGAGSKMAGARVPGRQGLD